MSHATEKNKVKDSTVTFIIRGAGLDLEAITQTLGISPSKTHRVGDPSRLKTRGPAVDDRWSLKSPLDAEEPMDAHLRWLAQQLEPHYEYIKTLGAVADVYIYCGFTSDSFQPSFSLSPEALAIFADLGVQMRLSLLFT